MNKQYLQARMAELASRIPRGIETKDGEMIRLRDQILGSIQKHREDLDHRHDLLIKRLETFEAELHRPDSGYTPDNRAAGSVGDRLCKMADELDLVRKVGRARFQVESFFPADGVALVERKTLIDTTAVGRSTPGILVPERVPGIVPLARRTLRMRDLIPSRPCGGDSVEYIKENVFTNAASPQTEGADKAESADTFTIASDRVRTIAHWIPATRQVLDDLPELQSFINGNLLYGLKLKEDTEILSGDNIGDHLDGLTTRVSAYVGTYAAGGDNKIDTLRHAILELENRSEATTGFVLNPKDWHDIELLKDEAGGAGTGRYLLVDPGAGGAAITVPTLWGRPVVVTLSMPVGKFLAGDFGRCEIRDRMAAVVDISTEHSDYFVKNKVAIRCEERICLSVYRTTAFAYGSF